MRSKVKFAACGLSSAFSRSKLCCSSCCESYVPVKGIFLYAMQFNGYRLIFISFQVTRIELDEPVVLEKVAVNNANRSGLSLLFAWQSNVNVLMFHGFRESLVVLTIISDRRPNADFDAEGPLDFQPTQFQRSSIAIDNRYLQFAEIFFPIPPFARPYITINENFRKDLARNMIVLTALFRKLGAHHTYSPKRADQGRPPAESRNPFPEAMFVGLHPWQPCPTWIWRRAQSIKLPIPNCNDERHTKRCIGEVPTKPVGSIFLSLFHLGSQKCNSKAVSALDNLQLRWSVA